MSKTTIKIFKASEPLKKALSSKAPVVLVETAPLRSTRYGLLAWFVSRALATHTPTCHFVWATERASAARRDSHTMILKAGLGHTVRKTSHQEPLVAGDSRSRLWFVHPDKLTHMPDVPVKIFVGENAHEWEDVNPSLWLAQTVTLEGRIRAFGFPVVDLEKGQWWQEVLTSPEVEKHRITITDDLTSGAETEEQAAALKKNLGDEEFRRVYLLQKPDPKKYGSKNFPAFCKERVKIRTDRDRIFLSPEQVATLDEQQGIPVVPLIPSTVQKKYLAIKQAARDAMKPLRFLLLKFRQGGFTTLEQAQNYETICTMPRSHVVTLAHTNESTEIIFDIARVMYEEDPRHPMKRSVGTKRQIELAELRSKFFIGTAGARSFGRGFTLQRVHGSEVAQWGTGKDRVAKVQAIMANLLPAAKNGEVVLETTPNGIEWFALEYMAAKKGESEFTPIFFRWFEDESNRLLPGQFIDEEIRESLTEEEKDLVKQFGLDHAQIAFRRSKKREHKVLFPQEYPEDDKSCFLSAGIMYFDQDRISTLVKYWDKEYSGKAKISKGKGVTTHIWEEPRDGEKYVIGADTSEGLPGCDPSGLGVMKKSTGEQVASVHGYMNVREQARQIFDFHKKYNKAFVGVERNNHGHAVLEVLTGTHGMRAEEHNTYQKGSLFAFKGSRPGWDTSTTSRPIMLAELSDAIEERNTGWHDREMLDECSIFRLQDDGKFEADPGGHDDRVMKWAVCEQMRKVRVLRPGISTYED